MSAHLHSRAARYVLLSGVIAAACWRPTATTVKVVAMPKANDTMAIEVDVLFIYQGSVAEELTAAGATSWFENRDRLLAKYNGKFFYVHWELVPGSTRSASWMPETEDHDGATVLVFADYVSGEPKLVNVTEMDEPLVYLCEHNLALQESCTQPR